MRVIFAHKKSGTQMFAHKSQSWLVPRQTQAHWSVCLRYFRGLLRSTGNWKVGIDRGGCCCYFMHKHRQSYKSYALTSTCHRGQPFPSGHRCALVFFLFCVAIRMPCCWCAGDLWPCGKGEEELFFYFWRWVCTKRPWWWFLYLLYYSINNSLTIESLRSHSDLIKLRCKVKGELLR